MTEKSQLLLPSSLKRHVAMAWRSDRRSSKDLHLLQLQRFATCNVMHSLPSSDAQKASTAANRRLRKVSQIQIVTVSRREVAAFANRYIWPLLSNCTYRGTPGAHICNPALGRGVCSAAMLLERPFLPQPPSPAQIFSSSVPFPPQLAFPTEALLGAWSLEG